MASKHASLVRRREEVMDRVEAALDAAWPERKGTSYVSAMQKAAGDLEAIAAQMQAQGVDEIEQSRSWRYLGSVYADLEPAIGKSVFGKARDAYVRAEALLAGCDDPLERAKLDFNVGNTLRQMDPNDVEQLREAERRFLSAQAVFAGAAPQYMPGIQEALASTRSLLAIAPVLRGVEDDRQDMEKLEQELEEGANLSAIAAKMQEVRQRHGGPAALFAKIQQLTADIPESVQGSEKHRELMRQMASLTDLVAGETQADADDRRVLELLRERLDQEAEAGHVSEGRADILRDALSDFARAMSSDSGDIQTGMDLLQRMREQVSGQIAKQKYLSHGIDRPPAGSRAAELIERFWNLRRYLLEEMNRSGKSDGESNALLDFNIRVTKADRRIYEAGSDDDRARVVDQEALRPLAVEIRRFAARHHPLLARPVWGRARVQVDTEALLFAGTNAVGEEVGAVCSKLGLEPLQLPKGEDVAQARWKQLLKAHTTVFDVGMEDGPERAAVMYELGVARALGKPVVVLSAPDRPLPFDIDVEPVLLTGTAELDAIKAAVDASLDWAMSSRTSGVRETLAHALARYSGQRADTYLDQTLKQLRRLQEDPDPVAVNAALRTLVDALGDDATMLLHPAWSPVYPAQDERRLFHVMPFGPDWADDVARRVERVCEAAGVRYIRGDHVAERDVIRSIWDEISRATHVLVDLTGFNANVALELGLAHTLGRTTLMVGQGDTVDRLYPMIAKRRFYPYETDSGRALEDAVGDFLS